jgi:hypothetical protein
MKKSLPILAAIALIVNASFTSEAKTPVRTQGGQEAKAKVAQLLEMSGYQYRKLQDNVWVIDYTGNQLKSFQVIVTSTTDLMLAGVVVAEKANMRPTAEFFYKLLKLSHDYDLIKIGLDGDDDLFVRVEARVKLLDAGEFKAYIKQLAAASDEVYGQIRLLLVTK